MDSNQVAVNRGSVPSSPRAPSLFAQHIQQLISAFGMDGGSEHRNIAEMSHWICMRVQQCSTWSALSFSQEEMSRYLATCSVFIASRCDSDAEFKLPLSLAEDSPGISIDRVVDRANVRLVDFFELLTSCITTLMMEGTEFHKSVNRAIKKLVGSSSLFEQYIALYKQMFHVNAGSAAQDPGARLGWTLFIALKESVGPMILDFELVSHIMASTVAYLYRESPNKIPQFKLDDELARVFGLRTEDIETHIAEMPERFLSKLFGDQKPDAVLADIGAVLNRIDEEYAKYQRQFSTVDFDERIFLSLSSASVTSLFNGGNVRESIGDIANLKSAPIYQMSTLKRQTTQIADQNQFFSSPLRSPQTDVHISPVLSTILSIQWLNSQVQDEPTEPNTHLREFFTASQEGGKSDLASESTRWLNDIVNRIPLPQGLSDQSMEIRRDLVKKIYYQVLLKMLSAEEQRLSRKSFPNLLQNHKFTKALLACSMEIVYFAYNQCDILEIRDILEFLELEAYDLSRVIESFVMNSTVLSRIMMRHLRTIEERVFDSMVWREGSGLYDRLKTQKQVSTAASMPTASDAAAPPISKELGTTSIFQTPARRRSTATPTKAKSAPQSVLMDYFFRKVFQLVATRIQELFGYFSDIEDPMAKMNKVWSVVCYALTDLPALMTNRHVDQIIMCATYAICSKVYNLNISFKNIISSYKSICETTRMLPPVDVGKILMQVPLGSGQLGDIVKFYNRVFIPATKEQILGQSTSSVPPMPMMPDLRSPPRRRVSSTANVFISPRRRASGTPNRAGVAVSMSPSAATRQPGSASPAAAPSTPMTPRTKALYSFGRLHTSRLDSPSGSVLQSPAGPATLGSERQQRVRSTAKRTLFSQTSDDDDDSDGDNDGDPAKRMRRSIGSASKRLLGVDKD